MANKTRVMIEASPASRYRLKAVAALRGVTIKELIEQTARELANAAGVELPASVPDSVLGTPDTKNAAGE